MRGAGALTVGQRGREGSARWNAWGRGGRRVDRGDGMRWVSADALTARSPAPDRFGLAQVGAGTRLVQGTCRQALGAPECLLGVPSHEPCGKEPGHERIAGTDRPRGRIHRFGRNPHTVLTGLGRPQAAFVTQLEYYVREPCCQYFGG